MPWRPTQFVEVGQCKVGARILRCNSFAADLNYPDYILLWIDDWRGHQLLNRIRAGCFGLAECTELDGFEDICVLHDHETIK